MRYDAPMHDLPTLVALLLLVAIVESSPFVRLPIGLLLAIGLLVQGSAGRLLPVVLVGAVGIALGRVALAVTARRGRDRSAKASPQMAAQRDALRARLADSPAYARITFLMGALPGVPAGFLFPLIGAMRAPLLPAVAGTIVGRLPILLVTTSIFAWLGRLGATTDHDAAVSLGILAALLLVFRLFGLVDWQHRAETGAWRMRDPDEAGARVTTIFTGGGRPGGGFGGFGGFGGPGGPGGTTGYDPRGESGSHELDDADVIDGEVLGEEIVDPDDEDSAGADDRGRRPRA